MRASGLSYDKQGNNSFLCHMCTPSLSYHMRVIGLFYDIKGQQIVRMPQEGNMCTLYHMRATIIIELVIMSYTDKLTFFMSYEGSKWVLCSIT